MSKLFEGAKVLHLEPTDVCQAECPLCARETDTNFNKTIQHHLDLSTILRLLGQEKIAALDKMFMCGNYGDPAAGKYTLDIYKEFRAINHNIVLGMNTNGGLQNTSWWQELSSVLNQPKDYVVFSIDGLSDTNHIYRKNVNWDKVMANAREFIKSGGSAHWDMLVYKHNQHQVDECERLAKDLGFKWFKAKVSKRQTNVQWLKPPTGWTKPNIESIEIVCHALTEQSIYIDAHGRIYPCCWQGYTKNTIDHFENIKSSWLTDSCDPVCKRNCGSKDSKTSFLNQWQRITEF